MHVRIYEYVGTIQQKAFFMWCMEKQVNLQVNWVFSKDCLADTIRGWELDSFPKDVVFSQLYSCWSVRGYRGGEGSERCLW